MAAPAASVLQSWMVRLGNQGRLRMIKLIFATAISLFLAAPTQAAQYMLMFYENEAEVASQRDNAERTGPYWDAWNVYVNALYKSGIVLRGDPLQPQRRQPQCDLRAANAVCRTVQFRLLKNSWAGTS